MNRLVRHRGPDDEGAAVFCGANLECFPLAGSDTLVPADAEPLPYLPRGTSALSDVRVALGHRRLSILDLSAAGHEPMCSADGRLWITYNGEIYNYEALRAELEQRG